MDLLPDANEPLDMPVPLPVAYSQGFAQIRYTKAQSSPIAMPAPANDTGQDLLTSRGDHT